MVKNNSDFKKTEEKIRKPQKSGKKKISDGVRNFQDREKKILAFWEKEKIYKFDSAKKGKIFSVDTPPPTVSGEMHIGHACSYSQQDFLIRFRRMMGFNIFYPFGTDDNGLATERLVEKNKGVKSKEMSRAEFIKLCMDFLKEELPRFIQDWKNIGISCDWNIYYSTINTHSRKISQWSFLDLYRKKRVYRKDAPAMWCPECRTGVAQVEVRDKEIDSTFNDIIFKSGNENLIIATTRPELLPSCVAVFYNPLDERYKKLKNKKAKVPLFNFEVPIMKDKRVDMKKGTGIVMCCTFGDQTDMEWQKAYNLPIKISIAENGLMTSLAGKYKGMKIKDARKEIINDLKKQNLLVKQIPIKHFVNVHERCDVEIEFVKSKQWFVKYLDLKKDLLKWGNELKWYPEHMKYRYGNWVKGLQWDWLISNQRHFGIPFPVWYCGKCGGVIVANEKQLPVDPLKDSPPIKKCLKCGNEEFIPEKDIFNTWFTSSMSPQLSILLMPKKIQDKLFPMFLRPQAHDIISFWLFNTLLKSRLHFGKNPWKEVAISGFVTHKGEKMSKSKGNIIRPQEVMERYGADAIRYWAASSKLGEDFDYQEKDVITGKKFITKLSNASNFVFMNLKNWNGKKPKKLERLDRLFLERLNHLIIMTTKNFEEYNYSMAKLRIENFFWKNFCDNYLEIIKKRIYNGTKEEKESAQYTLYNSLLTILKMFAPITPFITEEIYQDYFREFEKDKSIHLSKWPETDNSFGISVANDFDFFCNLLSKIRQEKTKSKKPMNSECIISLTRQNKNALKEMEEDLKNVTNAKEIKEGKFGVEFL